jgi:histidyl-tRNA synthetase
MAQFSTPRGMQDILPDDWPYWDFVIGNALHVAHLFGYRRIETPLLGQTSLFARSSGEATDVVDKEMYSFKDRGGEELSLRPEGTAPVVRAYLEHGMNRLPQPVKLSYVERMFRYDRPQRGRFREHRQFGCEAIGLDDAFIDAEMISLLDTFYRRIGLDDLSLHINSIGDQNCRPAYMAVLVAFLGDHRSELSEQDRNRLEKNPLRVLDSKDAESRRTIEAAPHMLDYLCDACRAHWEKLLRGLELLGLHAEIDHRLVRGLDYYTRTVFEFLPPGDGAQSVVGGGGRYDGLSEALGGPHVPGIGFGSGIERLVLNVRERGVQVPDLPGPRVYLLHRGPGTEDEALRRANELRKRGVPADMAFGERSLSTQMKHADRSKASYAAIIGEEEISTGTVTLKSLRDGEQRRVPAGELADAVCDAR